MLNLIQFNHILIPLLGVCFISLSAGLLSPVIVVKQRSYLIDTLAHLILPGVVVGLLLSKIFNLEVWICMASGAVVTAIFGAYLSEWFLKHLKIPPDASAILCLSAFLAVGILLLAIGKSESIDPETILFGDALTLSFNNLVILAFVFGIVLFFMAFYKDHWDAWLSDPDFAQVAGYRTALLNKLFPILVTIAVLAGFFAVGGLMIPALMTIPAIFTRPKSVFCIATLFVSLVLTLFGFFFAVIFNMPVGPTIVLLGALAVIVKTFFVKKCGQTISSV